MTALEKFLKEKNEHRGDDHNYSYMEPPPKKELDDKYVTKEAILERCCLRKDGSTVYAKEDILNAMDEYAKEKLSDLAAEMLDNTRYEEMWENQIKTIKKLKAELKDKAGNIDIPSLKITIEELMIYAWKTG